MCFVQTVQVVTKSYYLVFQLLSEVLPSFFAHSLAILLCKLARMQSENLCEHGFFWSCHNSQYFFGWTFLIDSSIWCDLNVYIAALAVCLLLPQSESVLLYPTRTPFQDFPICSSNRLPINCDHHPCLQKRFILTEWCCHHHVLPWRLYV